MRTTKWPIAIPVAVLLLGGVASGSAIHDEAKLFRPEVVEEAQRRLDRLERSTNIPVVIETVEHLPGVSQDAPDREKREAINRLAKRRDSQIRDEGIYLLISKNDRLISQPLIRARLKDIVPESRRDAIRQAFIGEFKAGNYDRGLEKGVETIEKTLQGHRVGNARAGAPAPIGGRVAARREEV